MEAKTKSLPDDEDISRNVYKQDQVFDDETGLTVRNLGPEEKFADSVLKSLKEKISDAREQLEDAHEQRQQTLDEAEQKQQQIIQDAEQEAEQIIQEAEQEAEQIIQAKQEDVDEARQEGYEDGYDDGLDNAQQKMAENVRLSQVILDEARRERNAYVDTYQSQLIQLSQRMAEQIVRETVQVDPDVTERVIEGTLDEIDDVSSITIVLHPDDLESVRDAIDGFLDNHPSLDEINLVDNSKMTKGGCRIRTEFGDLEATISGQLDHLSDQLIDQSLGIVDDDKAEQIDNQATEVVEQETDDQPPSDNPPSEDSTTDPEVNDG